MLEIWLDNIVAYFVTYFSKKQEQTSAWEKETVSTLNTWYPP